MPKISNKGFGFLPVIAITGVIALVGLMGYGIYLKGDDVLQANIRNYNTTLPSSKASNNVPTYPNNLIFIGISFFKPYTTTDGSGTINLKISTENEALMTQFSDQLVKNGVEVTDYCMTAICPKPRMVKLKKFTIYQGKLGSAEVPVTSQVKSISVVASKNIQGLKRVTFDFENNLRGWKLNVTENGSRFSVVRDNQPAKVDIYKKEGVEMYEFNVSGIGDDTAELIRTIRTSGIKRMDLVGSNLRTTIVKPAVTYVNGQGKFNVTALNNTRTFYVTPSRKLNIDISAIPDGWVKNKNGDGVDRVEKPSIAIYVNTIMTDVNNLTFFLSGLDKAPENSDLSAAYNEIFKKGVTVTSRGANGAMTSRNIALKPVLTNKGQPDFNLKLNSNDVSITFNTSVKHTFWIDKNYVDIKGGWSVNQKINNTLQRNN